MTQKKQIALGLILSIIIFISLCFEPYTTEIFPKWSVLLFGSFALYSFILLTIWLPRKD